MIHSKVIIFMLVAFFSISILTNHSFPRSPECRQCLHYSEITEDFIETDNPFPWFESDKYFEKMLSWQFFSAAILVLFVTLGIWHIEAFVKTVIIIFFMIYGIPSLAWRYSSTIRKRYMFRNLENRRPNADFSRPEIFQVEGCRNFHLCTDEHIRIGVWQLLPLSLMNMRHSMSDEDFDAALRHTERPVFIYMHGQGGSRANKHRIGLYKVLQKLDYHVIAFDYRGFGNSDYADLSEAGVVADSKFVVQWVMEKVKNSPPIFVWGHSLGTAISAHVVTQLAADNIHPSGLVLESPFNNIAEAFREVPICRSIKHLPWFHWSFIEPLYENNLKFESEKYIENIKCPVMIIHAEDDKVVPIQLGAKLFEAGLRSQVNDKIKMTKIHGKFGYGHNCIYQYEKLPEIIKAFQSTSLKKDINNSQR